MDHLRNKLRWLIEFERDLAQTILAISQEIKSLSPNDKIYKKLYTKEMKRLLEISKRHSVEISQIEVQLQKIIFMEDYL